MTDPARRIDAIVDGHRQALADIRRRVRAVDERSSRTPGSELPVPPRSRSQRIMHRVGDIDGAAPPPASEKKSDQRPRSWLT